MSTPHPVVRYSRVAVLLHWVLGFALIAIFGMGLYMADLPFSPQRLKLYNWHKWVGVSILLLSALRLAWRLTHRPPELPEAVAGRMPAWQRVAHHATHHALYLLFFAVPLLGWAYSSAAGFPIVWFGAVQLPDFVPVSESLAEVLKPAGYVTTMIGKWSQFSFDPAEAGFDDHLRYFASGRYWPCSTIWPAGVTRWN